MSGLLAIGGLVCLIDAFSSSHFGTRQHWEIGTGIVLVLLGIIIGLLTHDDDAVVDEDD